MHERNPGKPFLEMVAGSVDDAEEWFDVGEFGRAEDDPPTGDDEGIEFIHAERYPPGESEASIL